jgi:hypothetical protein
MTRPLVAFLAAGALLVAVLAGPTVAPASAGAIYLKSCKYFGNSATDTDVAGAVWQAQGIGVYSLANRCPQGGSLQIISDTTSAAGDGGGQWHTVTPPTIGITGAWTPLDQVLVHPGLSDDGFTASYFWSGGSQTIADSTNCCGGMDYGVGINRNDLNGSRYFGFQATCGRSVCYATTDQLVDVRGIQLTAQDNTPPSVVADGSNNVWYHRGWLRGTWPASFTASDDSGICGMRAIVDGVSIQGPTSGRNQGSWTQCPTPQTQGLNIDTTQYPDGPLSLLFSAGDAASPTNVSSPTTTAYVDNQPVGLSLSGPTDAPATAGTQYVTATATAGPSGVAIDCSVDGGPYSWFSGSTEQIPVQGLGSHQVVCYAQNGASNVQGIPATSATQTWSLSIRQPTVMSATLAQIKDPLRCSRHVKRVLVRTHWVKLRRHGKLVRRHGRVVRVRVRAHHKKIKVIKCHPRMVRRRERVHGHWRVVKVPVLPHLVNQTRERVAYGKSATVSGWLGMSDGTALGGQPVEILAAPNNGSGQFAALGTVSTAADGLWTATIPAGPSRLIGAAYGGSATTEPTSSADVVVTVPSRLAVKIKPVRVRWGKRIIISGHTLGGFVPANQQAVSELLRLRIGLKGLRISQTAGIPDVNRVGAFRTSYCFSPGHGVVHFWFSVSTLRETDYPFGPGSSRRIAVTVGPRTARHPCR